MTGRSTNYTKNSSRKISKTSLVRAQVRAEPFRINRILYPKYEFEQFHREWFDIQNNNKKTLILAPRGHAKSTVCDIAYVIEKVTEDPNIRILIVSNTDSQAQLFLNEIKMHFEKNERFRKIYGNWVGKKKWTQNEIVVNRVEKIQKEATVTALGVGGALTGRHFDIILADDILDFENTRTEIQRNKVAMWVGMTLIPLLEPGGEIHWLGTRYHNQDYYQKLLDSGITTNMGTQRALLPGEKPLWPEKFSRETLKSIEKDLGPSIFNAQYQNDASLMEGKIFKREWFKYIEQVPSGLSMYQTTDLAISKKDGADFFAVLTFGVDKDKNVFVMDLERGRYSFHEQLIAIERNCIRWNPVRVSVEKVAFQEALSQELMRTTAVPVRELTRVTDKTMRAYMIQGHFENGKIFFLKTLPELTVIESELLSFPEGEHDDIVDCISDIREFIYGAAIETARIDI